MEKRDSLDRHTRATNDVRTRRKLAAWLKGVDDVFQILEHLPEDQLNQVFDDDHAYRLLRLAERIMKIKHFYPIEGTLEHPEEWKVMAPNSKMVFTTYARETPEHDSVNLWRALAESCERELDFNDIKRQVTNEDIKRSWNLALSLGRLNLYLYKAGNNPIPQARPYFMLLEHPEMKNKVDPAEMKGLKRILNAIQEPTECK